LQNEQLSRTDDRSLAQLLTSAAFANRTLAYDAQFEKHVSELTVKEVNAAFAKYIDLSRLIIVTAGDFARVEEAAGTGQ
jgi:zinc protease